MNVKLRAMNGTYLPGIYRTTDHMTQVIVVYCAAGVRTFHIDTNGTVFVDDVRCRVFREVYCEVVEVAS